MSLVGEEVTFAQVVNTTRIYDPATNTWSTGAPMPDVRAFMASVEHVITWLVRGERGYGESEGNAAAYPDAEAASDATA